MDSTMISLLGSAGVDLTSVAVVLLLWRINASMQAQKDTLKTLIHDIDKRVTTIEAKG